MRATARMRWVEAARRGAALLLAMAVVLLPAGARAAPQASREAVYAAFTVNLTRFITWPGASLGRPGEPFLIGTFPDDPINPELDAAVQGESIAGHPFRTVRLRNLGDMRRCHVIFLSRGVADPAAVLAAARGRPILTISDAGGFLALGGHVRFVPQPPHTRLEISATNLRASGLQARAQLLRIAAMP